MNPAPITTFISAPASGRDEVGVLLDPIDESVLEAEVHRRLHFADRPVGVGDAQDVLLEHLVRFG
jgi:hypothetical protein